MEPDKIKDAVRTILSEIGEDVNREGLEATPDRVYRMYKNQFYGYEKKLVVMDEKTRNGNVGKDIIPITTFKATSKEMLIRSVKFISHCEHHIVPFVGTAYVGIIPDKVLLGMNKIDKIVKFFSARLQIQERLTGDIVDWIEQNIKPVGVMVIIKADHFCAKLQGDEGEFITSAVRGEFFKPDLTKGNPREEFLKLLDLYGSKV